MQRLLLLATFGLLLAGCPDGKNAAADVAALQPSSAIPAEDALLKHESLRLGMSNLEIGQAYNAPEGKGKGFTRGVEEFGDARNHIIDFYEVDGQPQRKIVLRVYQDKLALIVDRRDGLTEKQAKEWFDRLKKAYGPPKSETLSGVQWVWGEKDSISLTFSQDNNSPTDMSANVVLKHAPTYEASERYTEYREHSL
ncbi:MAG: hypothetical protein M3R04_07975 [bacterium]|nr:hypothetical protein [bacterium]